MTKNKEVKPIKIKAEEKGLLDLTKTLLYLDAKHNKLKEDVFTDFGLGLINGICLLDSKYLTVPKDEFDELKVKFNESVKLNKDLKKDLNEWVDTVHSRDYKINNLERIKENLKLKIDDYRENYSKKWFK